MLSTLPMLPYSDNLLHFPAFDPGFTPGGFTPWESELYSAIQYSPKPVISNPCSDDAQTMSAKPVISSSGSDDDPKGPDRSDSDHAKSCPSTVTKRTMSVLVVDERKRRRMESNRESARRSRMRKQKHLENLRNQVNKLRTENRELSNRLRYVMYHFQRVRTDNERLRAEHTMLRQKLSDIRQILVFRQLQNMSSAWPCNTVITEQIPALIT
ncbi:bZIP transcription factor RISBZ2-like [Argentina anserina]|uniref:bZIP transcription factor RISBZ2-like n=1 Tax=Argentina anserina TaxID=57926 RepID=UPI0021764343|nr:bZIP transcription factor RISBZ2-like [Potentilla anserina]